MRRLIPRYLGLTALITLGLLAAAPAAAFDGPGHRNSSKSHRSNGHKAYGHKSHGHKAHGAKYRGHKRRHGARDHRGRYGIDYRYQPVRHYRPRHRERFTAPRLIVRNQAHRYDPYYFDDFYYRPHRHQHSVYRFPVRIEGRWVHRPFEYCEGSLFVSGGFSVERPRFRVSVNF
ncbi:MAG: hypothetical protein OES25_12730 [Acidobacteriota bacterium]|nr:hypothetical protein [Acidobacteriota bacterium]